MRENIAGDNAAAFAAFVAADTEFHRETAELTDWPAIGATLRILRDKMRMFAIESEPEKAFLEQMLQDHEWIFAAIRDGDAARAEMAVLSDVCGTG